MLSTARGAVKISIRGLKVTTLLPPAAITADLIPPEGQPAGDVAVELEVEGFPAPVRAIVNGKSVRKALKAISEHGPDGVVVLLQGNLKGPSAPGGPFLLDAPGLSATPKVPKAGPTVEG
jgi:hypothetical protein